MWIWSSMSKTYFVANWKMNCPDEGVKSYMEFLSSQSFENKEVVICPPFPFLSEVCSFSRKAKINIGAQTSSAFERGAYTGDVSAKMLAETGAAYALVGHSERRAYFNETNELVLEKTARLLEAGLTPIICVGESLKEREEGKAFDSVEQQIDFLKKETRSFIVAYEPIWAIGTGVVAHPDQIKDMHDWLAGQLPGCPLLYGGSVTPQNASSILELEFVQGVLVGGASLRSRDFLKIIQN